MYLWNCLASEPHCLILEDVHRSHGDALSVSGHHFSVPCHQSLGPSSRHGLSYSGGFIRTRSRDQQASTSGSPHLAQCFRGPSTLLRSWPTTLHGVAPARFVRPLITCRTFGFSRFSAFTNNAVQVFCMNVFIQFSGAHPWDRNC